MDDDQMNANGGEGNGGEGNGHDRGNENPNANPGQIPNQPRPIKLRVVFHGLNFNAMTYEINSSFNMHRVRTIVGGFIGQPQYRIGLYHNGEKVTDNRFFSNTNQDEYELECRLEQKRQFNNHPYQDKGGYRGGRGGGGGGGGDFGGGRGRGFRGGRRGGYQGRQPFKQLKQIFYL